MQGTSFFAITGYSGKGKIDPSLNAINIDGETFLLDTGYISGTGKCNCEVCGKEISEEDSGQCEGSAGNAGTIN